MLYIEKEDKNKVIITATDHPIKLRVDCQYGTMASVSFFFQRLVTVHCGETKTIGTGRELKGKTVVFNVSAGNPGGGPVKIIFTVYEENGNKLVYAFPDDYTGSPVYNPADDSPSIEFAVIFV